MTNIGSVTALHPTPDPTNSRLDTVFGKVFDSRDGGDASDIVQPVVVPGAPQAGNPNAGTLLASRAGVGLVPSNSLWLADVYVPAAAPSAASFSYVDQRSTGQAWLTYMFSGSGGWTTSGVGPTMGDGNIVGKFQRNGKRVAVRIYLVFGAADQSWNWCMVVRAPVRLRARYDSAGAERLGRRQRQLVCGNGRDTAWGCYLPSMGRNTAVDCHSADSMGYPRREHGPRGHLRVQLASASQAMLDEPFMS